MLMMIFVSSDLYSQTNWMWQMPKVTGNVLYDIKMYDENLGFACGTNGTIIKTSNGGINWVLMNTNLITRLNSIFIIDSLNIISCGDSGKVLRTSNGGNNWSVSSVTGNIFLYEITFVNSQSGFVGGTGGTLLKSTNSGYSWFTLNSSTTAALWDIKFLNNNTGFIGGSRIVLKTTNGGLNWLNCGVTFISAFAQAYNIVAFDTNNVYAMIVSDNRVAISNNGGLTWTYKDIPFPDLGGDIDILRNMKFVNFSTGYIATDFGRVLKTTDAGNNWKHDSTFKVHPRMIGVLWGLELVNDNQVFVTGGGGTIAKSINSGNTYTLLNGWKNQINDLIFLNNSTAYSVGDRGDIYKTTNEGNDWTKLNSPTFNNLTGIDFINSETGFISGDTGVILKTTNAGMNWNRIITPYQRIVNDIHFKNDMTGYFTGNLGAIYKSTDQGNNWFRSDSIQGVTFTRIKFLNNDTAIILAIGRVYYTTNAGFNWNFSPNVSCNGMHFINENTGFVTGGNRIYKSTNSGLNWTQISMTIGTGKTGIYFTNENTGFVGGLDGYLIKTTNGGVNWNRIYVTNNFISTIYFQNSETGYVAGSWGNIIKTTNGGLTYIYSNSASEIPQDFELYQNYPNPFNPKTKISFTNNKQFSDVSLKIYDISGKLITELINKKLGTGYYETEFDGTNLASGIYFYTLKIDNQYQSKKMILIK